ncbi:hypothetical protein [Ferruginibacter sp.]
MQQANVKRLFRYGRQTDKVRRATFYEETVFTGVVENLPVVVRALINSDANIQRHFGAL